MQKNKKLIIILTLALMMSVGGCSFKSSNRKYNSGVEEYTKGEYEKAAVLFKEAIDKNPDKAEFYIDYGFTLIQLGLYEEALVVFEKAIVDKEIIMLKENNKKAYRGRGIAYYRMHMYDEAIEEFDLALSYNELTEIDLDILSYKGSALELSMRIPEALLVYSEMLEENEDPDLYRLRGDLYRLLSMYEESLADYNQALSLKEGDFSLYFGKYTVLKELNMEDEARLVLTQAAQLPVYTEQDKFDLAKVHFYQGEYDTAIMELDRMITEGFQEGYYFIGEIYLKEEQYDDAFDSYLMYLEKENMPSVTLYNQMLTCSLMGEDYDTAKVYLEKAKQMNNGSISQQLMKNEIILLEKTGEFEKALYMMEEYLDLYDDEDAYNDYIFLKTRVK